MKKHIALGVAAVLGLGTLALATPANAVEQEVPDNGACYVDETHTELQWELQETHWVSGPTPATIEAGWYTEADDEAPVASDAGLTFTADGTQATGLRTATTGELADVTGVTLPVPADDPYFHERLVVDVEGEPFGAGHWRNDYLSLNFVAGGVYVNTPASGWQTLSLDDVKALFPGADVTSIGFHLDSNTPEGEVRFVDGYVVPAQPEVYSPWTAVSTGQSTDLPNGQQDGVQFYDNGWYRYVVTGSVDVTEQVEVECPPIVLPAPVQVDECGTANDEVVVPEVDGVFYGVYDYGNIPAKPWWDEYNWESGDSIIVIASYDDWSAFGDDPIDPEDPSGIDSSGNPGWWFPAFTDVPCPVTPTDPPVTVEPAGNVTTVLPSSLASTGTDNGVLIGTFALALVLLVGGAFGLTVWHIRRRDAHKQ